MSEKKSVTLGLIQMSMSEDVRENLSKAVDKIQDAARLGAQIICLPELFTTPYFPQHEKLEMFEYAEKIPGPTTSEMSKVARKNKIILIGGSIFEKNEKEFYNTSVVFDADGKMIGKYRKMHIPHDPSFYEQNYFLPGNLGYKVVETKFCKVGIMICYDQWYPEAARINALMGAGIIFYPTSIGWVKGIEPEEGNWQEAWEKVHLGHAIANSVIVAAVNRVGVEDKMDFWGGSFVCDQFGKIIGHGGNKEEILIAECDLTPGKKVEDGWRFKQNRRPETYKKLVQK